MTKASPNSVLQRFIDHNYLTIGIEGYVDDPARSTKERVRGQATHKLRRKLGINVHLRGTPICNGLGLFLYVGPTDLQGHVASALHLSV